MRAGMEAVAYRLGLVFDLLRPLLPPQVEIVASGGALFHSTTWSQIIADVLGHPVTLSRVPEASARGAALLALEALGVLKDVGEAPQFSGTTYEPRSAYYERYRKAMARQQDLYYTLVATDQEERGTVP
jgi:Sugar (pentulose and hexulose) kinases